MRGTQGDTRARPGPAGGGGGPWPAGGAPVNNALMIIGGAHGMCFRAPGAPMFLVVDSSQRCPTTTLAPFVYWHGGVLPNVCNGVAAAHMRRIGALRRAKIGLQCSGKWAREWLSSLSCFFQEFKGMKPQP